MANSDSSGELPAWDVVVVTYNSARDLERYWRNARLTSYCALYAVDNGSVDGSAEIAESIGFSVIKSSNVGLSKSNNVGASVGTAENILFANPDVRLDESALCSLLEVLDSNPRSIVAPRLVSGTDHLRQANARQWPTLTRILANRFIPNSSAATKYRWPPTEPDWVSGACIAMKRHVFEQTVRWPESYFLYYEDVQLCLDARREGLEIHLADDIVVEHAWRRDSAKLLSPATAKHLKSALQFYCKNPRVAIGKVAL